MQDALFKTQERDYKPQTSSCKKQQQTNNKLTLRALCIVFQPERNFVFWCQRQGIHQGIKRSR